MADAPQTPASDDELLLDQQVDPNEPAAEANPDDDGEEIPTFGDTPEEEADTQNASFRQMRETTKEALRRAAEAERERDELRRSIPAPKPVEVGPEPTLEGCDWDEDKFKAQWREWNSRASAAESEKSAGSREAEENQRALNDKLTKVNQAKAALGKPDADEAFATVKATLGDERAISIAMITDSEEGAAKLMYALGRDPDRLAALAAIKDPIRYVKEVTRLEGQLKMVKRRKPIDPDTPERGSGKVSSTPNAVQKELEKLEKEAESNGGDRTKIAAFKKKHGITG